MMRSTGPLNTLVRRFVLASLIAGHGAVWADDAHPQSTPRTESPASEPIALRLKRFEIPFSVDSVGSRPVEVQLFVSRDAGKQWVRFGSQKPDGKSFLFEATEDGAYWFATRTLDGAGNAHPQGPITPQLHVLVDATDPQIELNAALKDESVAQLAVRCFDSTLRPDTLRVEYRTDLSSSWTGVPGLSQLVPSTGNDRMEGQLSFEPAGNWHQVSVRVIVKDGAGNQTIATHQLERARTASLQGQFASTPLQGQGAFYGASSVPGQPYNPSIGPAMGPGNATPIQPYAGQPYQGQPYAGQPLPGQPYVGQPYVGQPYVGQSYAGQPLPGPVTAGSGVQGSFAPGQPLPGQPLPSQPLPGQPLPGQFVPGQSAQPYPNQANSAISPANPYAVKAMELLNPAPQSATLPAPNAAAMIPPSDVLPMLQGTAPLTGGTALNAPNQSSTSSNLNPASTGTPTVAPESTSSRGPSTSISQAMRPMSPEDLARPQAIAGQSPANNTVQTMTRPSISTGNSSVPPASSVVMPRLDEATSTSPIRFSGSRKFSLDYEVESAGRAGVEEVELWGSTDRGQSWKRWGADPDRQSPFDIETNNDGTYGFCIVVVSKNGLATPRPLEQSSPDVFVVVDTVKPQTRITGASYGEGDQTGALLIRYECLDDNLGSRPIALSFSDSFHGPWTTIAAGLENRGGYAWPADPQLPRQIYLRIDAADQAGNVGYQVLDTPIDVQGLAPRARIRGLNPISNAPMPSYMQPQTAAGQSPNLR